ncbi:MAG: caspase family protein [Pseudomonadota bacterium]
MKIRIPVLVGALWLPASSLGQSAVAQPERERVFVLAMGNNRSLSLARPDLRYADDDAVKIARVLGAFARAEDVEVLARVDAETQATLHPEALITGLPTRDEVFAAAERLRARVQQARQGGQRTVLFLLFSGHGDQRGGKGFLELEDATLGRDDLRSLVQTTGVQRVHIVLDSCNSFFVIHPRRPGGTVWATAADVGEDFAIAGTEVGVFLSTSAEAQVFEWSHLQSGVFSHAVRSGFVGGADADGDARITYSELEGFVAIASGDVSNSLYRPHLYVQAASPDGLLLDLGDPTQPVVELAGFEQRATLRDEQGVRWADIHPEPGFTPRWILPMARGGSLLAELDRGESGRRLLYEAPLGQAARLTPAQLVAASDSPRGSDLLFAQVFASPFGPQALARHVEREAVAPPPVYGLTRAQEQRFETQLRLLARNRERTRMVTTGLALSTASALAVTGLALGLSAVATDSQAWHRVDPRDDDTPRSVVVAEISLAGSVLEVLAALLFLNRTSDEERIYQRFTAREPRSESERMQRVVQAYQGLFELSEEQTRSRQLISWAAPVLGGALSLAGVGMLFVSALDPAQFGEADRETSQLVGGILAGLGVAVVGLGLVTPVFGTETKAEIFFDVVEQDPESVSSIVP